MKKPDINEFKKLVTDRVQSGHFVPDGYYMCNNNSCIRCDIELQCSKNDQINAINDCAHPADVELYQDWLKEHPEYKI